MTLDKYLEKNQISIIAVASLKGGVGKTNTSNNTIPSLSNKNAIVYEIDNNNQTSKVYKESEKIKAHTFKTEKKEIQKAFDEIVFNAISDNKVLHIVDMGGGDDTKKGIDKLSQEDLKKLYFVPVMASLDGYHNLKETISYIETKDPKSEIIIVLNSFFQSVEDEFLFLYGSDEFGIERDESILSKYKIVQVPYSSIVEVSKFYNSTISDLANISKSYNYQKEVKGWIEQGRETYNKLKSVHNASVEAVDFIEVYKLNWEEVLNG